MGRCLLGEWWAELARQMFSWSDERAREVIQAFALVFEPAAFGPAESFCRGSSSFLPPLFGVSLS
jgi:hypothetical protein